MPIGCCSINKTYFWVVVEVAIKELKPKSRQHFI